nr:aspartate/glutamate racemase family protein [Ketogulonicigenium robustum]
MPTSTDPALFDRTCAIGADLAGAGAGVLVLGCADMGPARARLQAAIGIPVIDLVLAAVALAQGFLAAEQATS